MTKWKIVYDGAKWERIKAFFYRIYHCKSCVGTVFRNVMVGLEHVYDDDSHSIVTYCRPCLRRKRKDGKSGASLKWSGINESKYHY